MFQLQGINDKKWNLSYFGMDCKVHIRHMETIRNEIKPFDGVKIAIGWLRLN